jgi:HAD superfamily hydrolase (TIGR01484 family)
MKQALIADVDDTICPSTRPVSPDMAQAISRLVRGGRSFAFISGSTVAEIGAQLTPFLDVDHHLLGVSGSHYVQVTVRAGVRTSTEIWRHEFDERTKQRVLKAFRDLIERHAIRSQTTFEDQLQDRGSQVTLSAIGRGAADEAKRAYDPDGAKRRAWALELERELGPGLNIRLGGTTSVDVTPAGVDKEWGIRHYLDHWKLRASDALYFGDNLQEGGNDFPATKVVDCVAVRNPSDTLLKLAAL